MIIKELELLNFWSHKNTKVIFKENFYTILGKFKNNIKSNGSGKSTIARGIFYALHGDASDEIKNDEAIYNDAKELSVSLLFDLNNIEYRVTRSFKRNSTPVILVSVNGIETKYKIKEGQEYLNNLLGADYNIFKNTSYFKQGDLNAFSKLTPKEAKEVVINILQLDAYNTYELRAKNKVKEINNELRDIQNKLSNLEAIIKQEESRSNKTRFTTEHLKIAKDKLADFQTKQAKAEEEEATRQTMIRALKDEVEITKTKQSLLKRDIINYDSRIDKLDKLSGTCPTCEHTLDKEEIASIICTLNKASQPLRSEVITLEQTIEQQTKAYEDKKNEPIARLNYTQNIYEVSKEIGEIESELNQAQKDLDKLNKYKANHLKGLAKMEDVEKLLFKYEKLAIAFGKNGIQAYIIENVMPEIQATTNEILEGLDTPIRVLLESQKELKKGGKSETLEIKVLTPFGERPYINYSGGEKTFIDFALRIALAIVLARRSNCQIQTLILDEVWGQLDSANRIIASKALNFIANRFNFKKILIISHQEELQDSFPSRIIVEHDGIESKIIRND